MSSRRPRLLGLLLALLALLSQLTAASPTAAAATHGGAFASVHICGASLPGTAGDHPSDHGRTACPSCPVCWAAAVQAILPTTTVAPPAPSRGLAPHGPSLLRVATLPARLPGAAMPRGPPTLI